jgi:signal peptidase I
MLRLLKISGPSLAPEFRDGEFVVAVKFPFRFRPPRLGSVIVFRQPAYGLLIKRVTAIDPARREFQVAGNQPASVDSTVFGPVPFEHYLGTVVWHLRRPR